jgi:hypothetical protein
MRKITVVAACLVLVILIGFSYDLTRKQSIQHSSEIVIVITRDFGNELIQESTVVAPSGSSALECLKMVADVETSYGGGFVSSINGIRSAYPAQQYDWFFYVNGFLAKEGASSYAVLDGDLIQWDYHTWENLQSHNAALGGYPKFFINGYSGRIYPILIVFEDDFYEEATQLQRELLKRSRMNITLVRVEDVSNSMLSSSNIIIIGRCKCRLVEEISRIFEETGNHFFCNNHLVELDEKGSPLKQYSEAGLIIVTQNVWNPRGNMACETMILLISGTDTEYVRRSIEVIVEHPSKLKYSFGILITDQGALRIPRSANSRVEQRIDQ